MTDTINPTVAQVVSSDGTEIAVFVSGTGRPLVLVHGITADHTGWSLVRPLFEPHRAVWAVDRRGRGGSSDGPEYSLAREYEDVAAVVDAAAETSGTPVDLLGHSFGGLVAFGAATLTTNIRKLVLYEGWPAPNLADHTVPPDLMDRLDSLLAAGQPEQMLEVFHREIDQMSPAEFTQLKAGPTWPGRVRAAQTITRELRSFVAFDPDQARHITVPVLLIVGADSPPTMKADPDIVAATLPNARVESLDGQMHMAHLTNPQQFARHVLSFLHD